MKSAHPTNRSQRRRLRDLGISIGRYPPGPLNAITDVAGVRVGHTTLIQGSGPLRPGVGPIRTGVTAILPNGGNVFHDRVCGGGFVLNGAGEISGLVQVLEWGIIETPILLTNTLAVGIVASATAAHMAAHHPGIGSEHDVVLPLVGECDDSFLNDIAGMHVRPEHVVSALDGACDGPVAEGNVGGGTGMVSFDFAGGIGTSSRVLPDLLGGFTLGVLVQSNLGRLEDLRVDGLPIGEELAPDFATMIKRGTQAGSIIAVLGTDAPLAHHQLNWLCRRVALGIGRVGSIAAYGSGEMAVGFSTANRLTRGYEERTHTIRILSDKQIDPLYRAAIECTEEAILNAMCMSIAMDGVDGRIAPALPLDRVADICGRFAKVRRRGPAGP